MKQLTTPYTQYDFVAADIETTGFTDTDTLTTVGLEVDGAYTVFLNTEQGAYQPDAVSDQICAETSLSVTVRPCDSQGDLLVELRSFIEELDVNTTVFTFYNGETWTGGFDLRFLRSICLRTGAPFPFADYAVLDIMPIFTKHDRFNVTHTPDELDVSSVFNAGELTDFADDLGIDHPGSPKYAVEEAVTGSEKFSQTALREYCDANGFEIPTNNPKALVPVYKRIAGLVRQRPADSVDDLWSVSDCDPFGPDESKRAVSAYNNQEYVDLILHNVADVHKTGRLMDAITYQDGFIAENELKPSFF
jgi:hypothetical protein